SRGRASNRSLERVSFRIRAAAKSRRVVVIGLRVGGRAIAAAGAVDLRIDEIAADEAPVVDPLVQVAVHVDCAVARLALRKVTALGKTAVELIAPGIVELLIRVRRVRSEESNDRALASFV